MTDTFRGDNAHLVACIESLLSLDAAGALAPHGIGGHARTLLSAAAVRLAPQPVAPAFERISLDEAAAELLRDTIGEDHSEVTLSVGDGASGYGLYVWVTEYPEEGSIKLADMAQPVAPAEWTARKALADALGVLDDAHEDRVHRITMAIRIISAALATPTAAQPVAPAEGVPKPADMAAGGEQIWACKIGGRCDGLPQGADAPMRNAIADAFTRITGYECEFIFSGWGGSLTEGERAVHENRPPVEVAPEALAAPTAAKAAPAGDIEAALRDLMMRYEVLFRRYAKHAYSGDFQSDLDLALATARAALAAHPVPPESLGASADADRAVAASPSSPAVSPLRASIPSAEPEGYVLAPDFRGYAHLGIGAYLINHTPSGDPAELVISVATEDEKAGRVVGDDGPNPDGTQIQPDVMAVRLRFENVAGLDALEKQLRYLREVHFPARGIGAEGQDAQRLGGEAPQSPVPQGTRPEPQSTHPAAEIERPEGLGK